MCSSRGDRFFVGHAVVVPSATKLLQKELGLSHFLPHQSSKRVNSFLLLIPSHSERDEPFAGSLRGFQSHLRKPPYSLWEMAPRVLGDLNGLRRGPTIRAPAFGFRFRGEECRQVGNEGCGRSSKQSFLRL